MNVMSRVHDCCDIIDWRMQLVNPECQSLEKNVASEARPSFQGWRG